MAAEARRDVAIREIGERLLDGQNVGGRRPVRVVRTPHEMSKPTPPAEETTPPQFGSKAATPPIGKP